MYQFLLVSFFLISISLVTLIILQQGKDVGMGSTFHLNSSNNLFNLNSPNNFITKIIVTLTMLFFLFSLFLGNIINKRNKNFFDWKNSIEKKRIVKKFQPEDKINKENEIPE